MPKFPPLVREDEFEAHSARHQWPCAAGIGDDELNIKDSIMEPNNVYRVHPLVNFDGFTQTVAGTGVLTNGFSYWSLATGVNLGSIARLSQATQNDWHRHDTSQYHCRTFARINPRDIATGHEFYLGYFVTPAAIDAIQQQISWEIDVDGVVWARSGDGAAGQRIDTGYTILANGTYDLYYKYMNGSTRYYINTSLVAEITLNRPNAIGLYFTVQQGNPGIAAARECRVMALRVLFGAE